MKRNFLFLAIIIAGLVSCKKNEIPESETQSAITGPPVTPAIIYADSVDGTYHGTDIYHHYFMATGENGNDTTYPSVIVRIDSSASNRIIINSDTFSLDSVNHFVTIHPSSDWHIFNAGSFTFDSLHAYINWSHGSAYMSGGFSHSYEGIR